MITTQLIRVIKTINIPLTVFINIKQFLSKSKMTIFCYRGIHFELNKTSFIHGKETPKLHLNKSHYASTYTIPGIVSLKNNARLSIIGRVAVGQGLKITIHPCGEATLNNCVINSHCDIGVKSNLYIGQGTLVGDYCSIHDFDGHKIANSAGELSEGVSGIYIGNNVWIGERVIILKGVKIGNGSVIGAGSIVTHDIPDDCIAVGNPCRVIRKNIKWE